MTRKAWTSDGNPVPTEVVTIDVSQADLDLGLRRSPGYCPMHRALRPRLAQNVLVAVGSKQFEFHVYDKEGRRHIYYAAHSKAVRTFLDRVDREHSFRYHPPKPARFRLTVPIGVIRR